MPGAKECVGSSAEFSFHSKVTEKPLGDLWQGVIRCELHSMENELHWGHSGNRHNK